MIKKNTKSKVKSACVYWEPGERRSNRQRLRTGHSAFWVGLNTELPSLFRHTPWSLPSQPKSSLCRSVCLYMIPMVQISEWRSLGLSNSAQIHLQLAQNYCPAYLDFFRLQNLGRNKKRKIDNWVKVTHFHTQVLTMATLLWKVTG